MYINETIKKYLDDLAMRTPSPGGGSAAALSGAVACALMEMALNFTIGNKDFEKFEETAQDYIGKAKNLRGRFEKLFDEDIGCYSAVSAAYKMPKDTEADKLKRQRAVKEAFKKATLVPFHICQYAVEAVRMCPNIAKGANQRLVCDVEAAVRMIEASFYSAKINILENQKSIADDEFNKDITRDLTALEKELLKCREASEKEILKILAL